MSAPFRWAAIADDLTGGADLAGMLFEGGAEVVQVFGAPRGETLAAACRSAQAVVVSLKTRSIEPAHAVEQTLAAWRQIAPHRPAQLQFKYCSTFDSTARGNIGPVAGALMSELNTTFTVAVPALPVNGRTQYLGHLFVEGRLLSESPMRHHPLNPMEDSDLVRFLQRQTGRRVGLAPLPAVREGPAHLSAQLAELQRDGIEIALVDAAGEQDLASITEACRDLPLITGGSGFGRHLPRLWGCRPRAASPPAPGRSPAGHALVLSGSCSEATLRQLARWEHRGHPVIRCTRPEEVRRALDEAAGAWDRSETPVIASSAAAAERSAAPEDPAGFEAAFAALARQAVETAGVRTLIVAGGETSGAVVEALGVQAGKVASVVAPGVPALFSIEPPGLFLVLKSGNFGGEDFIAEALRHAGQTEGTDR